MTKSDTETAIIWAFREQFAKVELQGISQPCKLSDDNFSINFTIQDSFSGKGNYTVDGVVKLVNGVGSELEAHKIYCISGTVTVDEKDNSPIISFNKPLSVRLK